MPDDPVRAARAREWFVKAVKDLSRGDRALTGFSDTEDALFHCQQAIEKALKGFLGWHERPFRKTHNLGQLGKQCILIDATLEPLVDRASSLTHYAWVFRYPGEIAEPSLQEAKESLALAREVVDAVLVRLPADVRP